jgi:hypothetical protein
MNVLSRAAISTLLLVGVALPALAQSPAAGNATTAPATHEIRTAPANATTPSQRNTVLTDQGDLRASKLIGASVYNDRDEKWAAWTTSCWARTTGPTRWSSRSAAFSV